MVWQVNVVYCNGHKLFSMLSHWDLVLDLSLHMFVRNESKADICRLVSTDSSRGAVVEWLKLCFCSDLQQVY